MSHKFRSACCSTGHSGTLLQSNLCVFSFVAPHAGDSHTPALSGFRNANTKRLAVFERKRPKCKPWHRALRTPRPARETRDGPTRNSPKNTEKIPPGLKFWNTGIFPLIFGVFSWVFSGYFGGKCWESRIWGRGGKPSQCVF